MADYDRLQQALRQRQRIEVRYAVEHRDTGRRWLMTRVEPAELSGGRAAVTVVTLDVTEEENARRHNEQLLHELGTILEVSPPASPTCAAAPWCAAMAASRPCWAWRPARPRACPWPRC
jgi:PAS domain-containing protein